MQIYSNLKVYKQTYDLLQLFFTSTPNIQRDYRYTLGEKIKADLIELCLIIYRANKCESEAARLQSIDQAREMLVRVLIQCRILYDLKQISVKLFALISHHNVEIQRQLDLWCKYSQSRLKK